MSQTFSFRRFALLLRTYLLDNRGMLLINILLLAGILAVLALFFYNSYPDDVDRNRFVVYFLIGWAAWYVFTVQQVSVLNEKERAINYLLCPASTLEKYLLIVVISGVGFLTVYLTAFTLIDAVGISYINHRNWSADQLSRIQSISGRFSIDPYYLSERLYDMPKAIWVFSGLIHPVSLAFALLLRRFTLPLVAAVMLAVAIVGMVGNGYFINGLFGDAEVRTGVPFTDLLVMRNNSVRHIEVPEPIGSQIRYVVGSTAVILLYMMGYFRLKEREV